MNYFIQSLDHAANTHGSNLTSKQINQSMIGAITTQNNKTKLVLGVLCDIQKRLANGTSLP